MVNKEKLGEPIGVGGEKKVYQDPEHPDRIVGVFKEDHEEETSNQIKARFYFTKILHLLFPKNIPDMHWAGNEPNAFSSAKVEHDENHHVLRRYSLMRENGEDFELYKRNIEEFKKKLDKLDEVTDKISNDPNVINFKEKLEELGIKSFDQAAVNFSKDSEGNVLYLDTFYVWKRNIYGKLRLFCDFDKLENAFENLSEDDRSQAKNYLSRLKKLYEEESNSK